MYRVESPIADGGPVEIVRSINVDSIIHGWARLGYDPSQHFQGVKQLDLYRCCESQLQFYHPCPLGAEAMYEAIAKQPWYYAADKWEFRRAVEVIKNASHETVFEIGCGSGTFLRHAANSGLKARGIDMNAAAIRSALRDGLMASAETLADVSSRGHLYDVVCAFQVLEHIAAPRQFLAQAIQLVKPGGLLIMCTPDADGWLGDRLQLLDAPPHHALRWGRAAFQFLTKIFPLHLECLLPEPSSPSRTSAWAMSTVDPDPTDTVFSIGRRASLYKRVAARVMSACRDAVHSPSPTGGQALMAVWRCHK